MNRFAKPSDCFLTSVSTSAWMRASVVLVGAATAGCATSPCPSFRASWYLVDVAVPHASAEPTASMPTIYLALLNESPQEMRLVSIVVNPTEEFLDERKFPQQSAVEKFKPLMPGELRLFDVNKQVPPCHLPVAVRLNCGEGRSHKQAVSGSLPNYLHSSWIKSCQPK